MFIFVFTFIQTVKAQSDSGHTFPVEGKIYVIHRFNDQNSYIYENGTALNASASSNTNKQYWRFVPTTNANCYYIQNVTTGHYVQSSHSVGLEQQVRTGNTPVEYQICQNTTNGASPKGYYYMCSTDQTIQTQSDGTWGLNYQQSTGKVVAYHIRYNRPNSYWDIIESNYDYEAPQAVAHTALQKQLGIYVLPCGTVGNAWLKSLSITGMEDNVEDALNYSASSKPSDYFNLVRTDSAEVYAGKTFTLAFQTSGMDENHIITAYFDWDKDGVFEAKQDFGSLTATTTDILVPDTAKIGTTRMRFRLNDNGADEADDEVNGQIYDFLLKISSTPHPSGIQGADNFPKKDTKLSKAYSIEGKQVNLDTHKGIYIQSGKKKIK